MGYGLENMVSYLFSDMTSPYSWGVDIIDSGQQLKKNAGGRISLSKQMPFVHTKSLRSINQG